MTPPGFGYRDGFLTDRRRLPAVFLGAICPPRGFVGLRASLLWTSERFLNPGPAFSASRARLETRAARAAAPRITRWQWASSSEARGRGSTAERTGSPTSPHTPATTVGQRCLSRPPPSPHRHVRRGHREPSRHLWPATSRTP